MRIEEFIQPFLIFSLVLMMVFLFFFTVPAANVELFKMCLTAMISFISGTSLALAMLRAGNRKDK